MNPSFPFNLLRYDLAVIPAHDRGVFPQEAFRTLLTPSVNGHKEPMGDVTSSLPDPSRVRTAVFLGGNTRHFQISPAEVRALVERLEALRPEWGDYILTTSRRTPPEIVSYLKEHQKKSRACQWLVIAAEDPRPEVVPTMMGMAEILIVTEDSISMISEAVRAGKKVLVLEVGGGLPSKHRRFKELLLREAAVTLASAAELEEKLTALRREKAAPLAAREEEVLQRRLQAIL